MRLDSGYRNGDTVVVVWDSRSQALGSDGALRDWSCYLRSGSKSQGAREATSDFWLRGDSGVVG
jgi:hypothetical protein